VRGIAGANLDLATASTRDDARKARDTFDEWVAQVCPLVSHSGSRPDFRRICDRRHGGKHRTFPLCSSRSPNEPYAFYLLFPSAPGV
jgi:hypothetical protein